MNSKIEVTSVMASVYKKFHLEIAHFLTGVAPDHPCARMHGHSLEIVIEVRGLIDPIFGWVQDSNELTNAFKPLHQQLDHHCLNDLPGLNNPTSENLAQWIWNKLKPQLPLLYKIEIAETRKTGIIYYGPDVNCIN